MNTNGRMQKAVARGTDRDLQRWEKYIKIESEKEMWGYREDRQKWSRIMGSYQLPRSIPHPQPISHGNYADHHERLTKKEKKHHLWTLLITKLLPSTPQVCRCPTVTSASQK